MKIWSALYAWALCLSRIIFSRPDIWDQDKKDLSEKLDKLWKEIEKNRT